MPVADSVIFPNLNLKLTSLVAEHNIEAENVDFGRETPTSFLTVRKRRPLQALIFSVDFVIPDLDL